MIPRQPWVGQTAFAHKGGMHVHAIDRVARSYEHIQPEAVGNSRRVLVSDMSGRTNILMKARELGFKLDARRAGDREPSPRRVKELENAGLRIRGRRRLAGAAHPRQHWSTIANCLSRWRRITSPCAATKRNPSARPRCKVRVDDKVAHTVAEGDGPVNALDGALRQALVKFFPQLKNVALTDYKVRIIDGTTGTAAKTRVLITSTDGKREWGTVGVSENIIEASLQALVDTMEFALLKK